MFFVRVVVELDAEDDDRADGGDDVGDDQRPVLQHDALDDEEYRAEAEHAEGGHGNAVGVAGLYGGDGLGQIAQHHADACCVADDGE